MDIPDTSLRDAPAPASAARWSAILAATPRGWNLTMFHSWSRGLIRLSRLDRGAKPLPVRGEYPLRIEIVS